ncbi:NVEALA domain-containing protein [Proteiniphilum acetatigenes]|uniref:NVEALA domain-containing protein n=1 Tax=Proteiniphilum acetatigenes TaxID=294710 RepID=UPI000366E08B|nr:NVEALA domain-containing protein [Proteiniphilum acetatigenes]
MKKKILSGIFALSLLVATGYGVNKSMKGDVVLSYLALNNVEALANGESSDCPNGCLDAPGLCYCRGSLPFEEKIW